MDFSTTTTVKAHEVFPIQNCKANDAAKVNDKDLSDPTCALDNFNISSEREMFIKQERIESGFSNNVSDNISNALNTSVKEEEYINKISTDLMHQKLIKNEVIFLPVGQYHNEDHESYSNSQTNCHSNSHTEEKPLYYNHKQIDTSKSTLQLPKNRKTKIINCMKCNYKCTKKLELTQHMQTHIGEKLFNCAHCDYKGGRKSDLLRHARTHTGEKPFTCSYCDYKSSQKANLKKHLRYHTGEKPFNCTECDYKCFQKNQLVDHQIIHTGEKPLNCSLCDYRCIRKGDLTSHMKTHSGEKQFSCSSCNYKCYRKTNLIRHMQVHTKQVYSCTFCNFKCLKQSTFVVHLRKHAERNRRKSKEGNCNDKVEEVLRQFISQSQQMEMIKVEEFNLKEGSS